MKRNPQTSIDGFVPRRSGSQLGSQHVGDKVKPINRSLHTGDNARQTVGVVRENKILGRTDIDESLREIDEVAPTGKKLSRKARKQQNKRNRRNDHRDHPKSKTRRIIKRVAIALLIILIGIAGFLLYKTISASDSVFRGSFLDLAQSQPLKVDANGRSNFLILGTSEDDPGHEAAYLTDSILVLSVNQKTKDAFTFSIPRDLYVKYGMACLPGYSGKVNSYFSCANQGKDDAAEQDRLTKTQSFIGGIVGMDIQYGVHVNYTVMRDVVNAIGGDITVKIESRDPNGQMDSNFDWKCGASYAKRKATCPPNGHFIDYPNGPAILNAEHALYLAQARGDTAPTYGFEQSNFDRERNQQKILIAIRDKAMSAGVLTNIGSVTSLVEALGKNLRTNIETKEIRTLMGLAKDVPSNKITSIDLYKEGMAQFTTKTIDGAGSVVLPAAGQYNYTKLQAYINKIITAEPFMKEEPNVSVYNGSGTAGMAQTEADKLIAKGFIVNTVENAPDGTYGKYEVYQINAAKTLSAAKLKEIYGVTVKTTKPPVSVVGTTDFVVIIGSTQQ